MLVQLVFVAIFALVGFFLVLYFTDLNLGQLDRMKHPGVVAGFACLGLALLLTLAMTSYII